jgi:hypothetical protein
MGSMPGLVPGIVVLGPAHRDLRQNCGVIPDKREAAPIRDPS